MINNNNKNKLAANLPFPDIYRSPHIRPTHKWGRRWMGGGEILKEIMMMLMMMMTDDLFDDTYGDYDDNHDDDDDFINLSSSQPEANHSYLQQQPR